MEEEEYASTDRQRDRFKAAKPVRRRRCGSSFGAEVLKPAVCESQGIEISG
jgi:hypothetical protein